MIIKSFTNNKKETVTIKLGFLILLSLGSLHPFASAQEKLFPLYENTALQQLNQPAHKIPRSFNKSQTLLSLPFFDDFSTYTGYPSDSLWMDNEVYVNTGYPINPPSTSVATFDGLNSLGRPYNPGSHDNGVPTDTLTSGFIDLSKYTAKDSLYLSFSYQPGGQGETPDGQDSLMLEFKPDSLPIALDSLKKPIKWSTSVWVKMWAIQGNSTSPFKVVIIPIKAIKDTIFFQSRFQFRFRALGNQSGNLDIWNLDYVLLNRGRNRYDTASPDVAVYEPSNSLIKGYYSIPWNYYTGNTSTYYTDSIDIFAHNNSLTTNHVTYSYDIKYLPLNTVLAERISTQVNNLTPSQFYDFKLHADSLKAFTPKNPDSVVLAVHTVAHNDNYHEALWLEPNDTATHLQIFNTYLAYDDGTAENGYGITNTNTTSSGSEVALKFDIPKTDTLYGIGIHFNQSKLDVSNSSVSLRVWSSINTAQLNNTPDKIIAELENIKPEYSFDRNGFFYFPLDTPRAVTGSFYLGWDQISDFLLNVGFDRNFKLSNSAKPILYYNIDGIWSQSSQQGVPMIRAYVGKKPVIPASINNNINAESFEVNIYPNPSKGSFTISLPEDRKFNLEFIDINGKVLANILGLYGDLKVNTNYYPAGVYILKITDPATNSRVFKKVVLE